MIRSIADFVTVWTRESDNTAKLFREIPDASMPQAIAAEHRDLGRIAWHTTVTIREMLERTGLHVHGPHPEAPVPTTTAEIVSAFESSSASLVKALEAWTDKTLEESDDMYGERWTRAETLLILILHQTHHRGQMTVLMRQAGLPVPGMYGPSKEDWAKYGLPLPAV